MTNLQGKNFEKKYKFPESFAWDFLCPNNFRFLLNSQFSEADRRATKWKKGYESFDSIPSMISDVPPGIGSGPSSLLLGETASHISEQMSKMCMDSNDENYSPNEVEEKARLISQVQFPIQRILK